MTKKIKQNQSGQEESSEKKLVEVGVTYSESGEYEKSIEMLKEAIKLKPDDAETHYILGVAYLDAEERAKAVETFKKATELKPDFAKAYIGLGFAYAEQGMYQEAIVASEKAVNMRSDDVGAYFVLGTSYYFTGERAKALKAFEKATELKPDFAEAYNFLRLIYAEQGMYQEAIVAFEKALEGTQDDADMHCDLGILYLKTGDHSKAAAAFEKAKELKPDFAKAYIGLAGAFSQQGMEQETIVALEKLLKLKPDLVGLGYDLGIAYLKTGQHAKAIAVLKKALKKQPDDPIVLQSLGVGYYNIGEHTKAVASFEKAKELKPDFAEIYLGLGLTYVEQGMHQEAITAFEKVLEIDSDLAMVYYVLGSLLLQNKQYERAAKMFQIAQDKFLLDGDLNKSHESGGMYAFVLGVINWISESFEQACKNFFKASKLLSMVKSPKSNLLSMNAKFISEVIPIDIDFLKLLFSSESLNDFKTGIKILSDKTERLSCKFKDSQLSVVFPPIEAKFICINEISSALETRQYKAYLLDGARIVFRDQGFTKCTKAVNAIENFIMDYIDRYKETGGQLSSKEESLLLEELKPATDLDGMLSLDAVVAQITQRRLEVQSFKDAIENLTDKVSEFEAKSQRTFTSISEEVDLFKLLLQKGDIYVVYIKERRKEFPASYVNDTMRKNKDNYDLWIDTEFREVRINKKPIDPGNNVYNLLIYIAKNVGKFCPRSEMFHTIWGVNRHSDDHSYKTNLQQTLSRYVYKYDEGKLKEYMKGEKGGYYINKKLNSCLISSILGHSD